MAKDNKLINLENINDIKVETIETGFVAERTVNIVLTYNYSSLHERIVKYPLITTHSEEEVFNAFCSFLNDNTGKYVIFWDNFYLQFHSNSIGITSNQKTDISPQSPLSLKWNKELILLDLEIETLLNPKNRKVLELLEAIDYAITNNILNIQILHTDEYDNIYHNIRMSGSYYKNIEEKVFHFYLYIFDYRENADIYLDINIQDDITGSEESILYKYEPIGKKHMFHIDNIREAIINIRKEYLKEINNDNSKR